MPLTIVVGGQYGGEGKGLITAHLSQRADCLVKVGGPNSAHSFGAFGQMFRVRMMPSGSNLGVTNVIFPAGCLIHVDTLFAEMDMLQYNGQISIDYNCGIVDPDIVRAQQNDSFYSGVGSTLTGTGHASSLRSLRRLRTAAHESRLQPFLADTQSLLAGALRAGKRVVVEGAQAFGLSNYHGHYPYVSSRDTTVGSFLGQMGLGPKLVDEIVLVIKCFPTRNSGGHGRLPHELDEGYINCHEEFLVEKGGGTFGITGASRRVGLFDFEVVDKACVANTPTTIALTGADRLEAMLADKKVASHYGSLDRLVDDIESRYDLPVSFISNGPWVSDVAERHTQTKAAHLQLL